MKLFQIWYTKRLRNDRELTHTDEGSSLLEGAINLCAESCYVSLCVRGASGAQGTKVRNLVRKLQ